jgi:hypothetical protein
MREGILILSEKDLETLGSVRNVASLRLAKHEGQIWVRGDTTSAESRLLLAGLPVCQSFELDDSGNLFPPAGLTPVGKIKELEWMPILEFIRPELPVSALPGKVETTVPLRLVPAHQTEEGSALLCVLEVWKAYVEGAPEVRLNRLKFAVSANNQVLIVGTPLPSIPGQEYWLRDQMLLPGGLDLEFPFLSGRIAQKLQVPKDALLLIDPQNRWQIISADDLKAVTRSAVRLTKERESNGNGYQ